MIYDVIILHVNPKTKMRTEITINVDGVGMNADDISDAALFEAEQKYSFLDWNREPNGSPHYDIMDVYEHEG